MQATGVKPWQRAATGTSSNELLGTLQRQSTGLEAPQVDPETANKIAEQREAAALMDNQRSPADAAAAGQQTEAAGSLRQTGSGLGGLGGVGSLGSGYGGLGGLGGYGGYGGMGGMGGMGMGLGMGMGGMYGSRLGGYGMGGMMDENSSFFKSIQFMESMSFVVNSMCEVVRMLETNTEGILHLWTAITSLFRKSKDWLFRQVVSGKDKFVSLVFRLLVLLRLEKDTAPPASSSKEDEASLFMSEEELAQLQQIRKKKRVYRHLMKASVCVILLCLLYFYKNGRIVSKAFSPEAVAPTASDALDKAFESLKA